VYANGANYDFTTGTYPADKCSAVNFDLQADGTNANTWIVCAKAATAAAIVLTDIGLPYEEFVEYGLQTYTNTGIPEKLVANSDNSDADSV